MMATHVQRETLFSSAGETLFLLSVENLDFLCAYQATQLLCLSIRPATVTPRLKPLMLPIPIHIHKVALHKTAKQTSITLVGELYEYKGLLDDGEFNGSFAEKEIKQEFATTDNPEYNGAAERGLAMIESAAQATRTQASELLAELDIPEGPPLWAKAMTWSFDVYNWAATVANPEHISPHEISNVEIP